MKYQLKHLALFPVLRGGDPIEEVLAGIRAELAKANEAGDGTKVAALEAQIATLTAGTQQGGDGGAGDAGGGQGGTATATQGDGQKSAEELLAEYRMREEARTIAATVVQTVEARKAAERSALTTAVQEEVARMLGHDNVSDAVKAVLAGTRQGSRFAGPGADGNVLDQLAAGGSVQQPAAQGLGAQPNGSGDHRGLKALQESKHPLGEYVRGIYRLKAGIALEHERLFVAQAMQKAMAEGTPSAGGYLVPAEYLPDVLGLLRETAVFRRAGARVVNFDRSLSQTVVSSGTTSYYQAENAQMQVSEMTFGEQPLLSPKNLTALVPVSNYLLNDAAEAERIIREDMADEMAAHEDLSFLRGTGAGASPVGLRNKAGITLNPIAVPANGFAPSIMDLRRIRARFRAMINRSPRPAWFFNTNFLTYLETLADLDGRPLLETSLFNINDDGVTGTIDGLPFFATTAIPANLTQGTSTNATDLMLVDLNGVIIGASQELEIDVSTEASYWDGTQWVSTFQNNQSVFRGVLRHDIAHRRTSQIIVQTGVLV
jgi:HK97 family phage major capsid protein